MVSIKDIARISGFSVTTVSRALNNHNDVNEQTKQIIQKIANEHNYTPNILAKSLVNKSSKTFGFITSNFSSTTLMDSFSFKLFMNSINRANELGFEVVLIHYNAALHNMKSFSQIISERNLEGAIIQGFDEDDPFCDEAAISDIPTVFIDIERSNKNTAFVSSDIKKAVSIGFSYLLSMGHQSICFVHGSNKSWVTSKWLSEVKKYKQDYNMELKKVKLLNGEYSLDITREKVKRFYGNKFNFNTTAIFTTSDVMGIGAMKALNDCNLNIPTDISVLGYDNIILSEYMTPSLTTISQNLEEVANNAIDILIDLVNGKVSENRVIEVQLIERESVGPIND